MKKTAFILYLVTICFCAQAQFNASQQLDLNNVNAGFLVHGDMFWNPDSGAANYEFPKNSGKHSAFGSALWIGGYNQATSALHVAAQTYRQNGNDYWPGPLDENIGGVSDTITAADWAQIWKVNASTIDSFIAIASHTISNTHISILEWPAKGNPYSKTPANGPLTIPNREMAPYVDVNNDEVYNALDGDYPYIKGEQMLWWVFNDNSALHGQTNSLPLKIEIHASAYACRKKGLENTTFLNYKIYNWNTSLFDSTVIALWNDSDLGYAFDDYIGFDSTYRMGVIYNGDLYDESTKGYGFGLTQHGIALIKSPFDIGNNKEPFGAFTYFNNSIGTGGNPTNPVEYYNYMTARWKNGSSFMAGCTPEALTGTPTKYVFQDDPSILGGISEPQCNRVPSDRRFVMSSKPFTMLPGTQPIEFTFAFINTDTGVNNSNFNELRRLADSAYKYVDACSGPMYATNLSSFEESNFKLYPNPANNYLLIEDVDEIQKEIKIYSTYGQLMSSNNYESKLIKIKTSHLATGIYFIEIVKDNQRVIEKILIE